MEEREFRIRMRETVRDIKTLDRSAMITNMLKREAVRTKDLVGDLIDDGAVTPEEYGEDRLRQAARGTVSGAERRAERGAAAVRRRIGKNVRLRKERHLLERESGHGHESGRLTDTQRETTPEMAEDSHGSYGVRRHEAGMRAVQRREGTTRAADMTERKIKQRTESSGKTAVKTVRRTMKTAGMTAKGTMKTARVSAEAAKKSAEASARAAKTAAAVSKKAAAAAYKAAAVTAKAVAAAVKGIIAATRELIVAIAAGGWISVAVIVVICLTGLVACSGFGIIFSNDNAGGSMTMREAVRQINEDYEHQIEMIKMQNPYDDLEMSGSRAVWPEVLSVYAIKTTTDPDNAMDVAVMDGQRLQILSDIFWEMNEISYRTDIRTETKIVETDDGNGNIIQEETLETHTILSIDVSHLNADEMAVRYDFDAEQNSELDELLAADSSLWLSVLYGVYGSDDMIVQVALSQVGNIGGEPYWSWYGFNSHVEWCACFVSWCADQCGYIENGTIPKYAGCVNGVNWFRERGQWADNTIEPTPGMIIFFDWDDSTGASGPQDGLSDHTGIVEKAENGFVYTVEGNSRNRCVERRYPLESYTIMGYGIPAY